MNPFLAYLLTLLWLVSNAASADEPDAVLTEPQTVASVQIPMEPHLVPTPVVRFRDLFLAASVHEDEERKPYRLSAEERQRMREQLRAQAPMALYKK